MAFEIIRRSTENDPVLAKPAGNQSAIAEGTKTQCRIEAFAAATDAIFEAEQEANGHARLLA